MGNYNELTTTKKGNEMTNVRITLIHTNDPHTNLRPGDQGTLTRSRIDPWGDRVVSVKWDSGSSLSLIEGQDRWSEEEVAVVG
jgi:hypothetical protein